MTRLIATMLAALSVFAVAQSADASPRSRGVVTCTYLYPDGSGFAIERVHTADAYQDPTTGQWFCLYPPTN